MPELPKLTFLKKHRSKILRVLKISSNVLFLVAYGLLMIIGVTIPTAGYVVAFIIPIVTIVASILERKVPSTLEGMKKLLEEMMTHYDPEDVQKVMDEVSQKSSVISDRRSENSQSTSGSRANMESSTVSNNEPVAEDIVKMNAYYNRITGDIKVTPRENA